MPRRSCGLWSRPAPELVAGMTKCADVDTEEKAPAEPATAGPEQPARAIPFRFYDNRQKYLAFVNTCNEKTVIAARAGKELGQIKPVPPAVRMIDAGMGDGTVLSRLIRTVHHLHPTVPLVAVAKEISLEDVR